MRIAKIKISNLASIEGEHLIDFEKDPLLSTGIFAISGPTGAGKSTILDAMCLALYDKIPRFEGSADSARVSDVGKSDIMQNDVRNILRRGSKSGFAEVEFVATDDLRYRSVWKVRRAYDRVDGKLGSQTLEVHNLSTGIDIQGTKSELLNQLVRLIGLSYDQFTRTVLLAQNDFATFLKSKEKEKAELLEKLTGTDIYSKISETIYREHKVAKQTFEERKMLLDHIQLLSEEDLAKLTTRLTQVEKVLGSERETLEGAKKKQEMFTKLAESLKSQKSLRQDFTSNEQNLTKSSSDLATKKSDIERFEQQTKAKEAEIEKAVEQDAIIKTRQEALGVVTASCTASEKELGQAKTVTATKQKSLEVAESKLKVYYQKFGIAPDMAVQQVLSDLDQSIKNSLAKQETINATKNKIDIQKVNEQQTRLQSSQKELNQLKSDYLLYKEKSQQLSKLQLSLQENKKNEALVTESLNQLKTQFKVEKSKLELAKESYTKAQISMSKDVQSLRANLHSGESCPVCGSKEHEFTNEAVENLFKVFEDAFKESDLAFNKVNNDLIAQREKLKALVIEQANLTKTIDGQQQEVQTLADKHDTQKFTEEYIKLTEVDLKQLESELNQRVAEHTKLQQQVDKLVQEQNKLQEQITTLSNLNHETKSITWEVQQAKQQEVTLQKSYDKQVEEMKNERSKLDKLQEERTNLLKGKAVKEVREYIQQKKKEQQLELEELQKKQLSLSQQQGLLKGKLEQLNLQIEELQKSVGTESIEKNATLIQQLSTKIKELETEKSNLDHTQKTNDANLVEAAKLKKASENLFVEMERWAKLNELLGSADGSKFKVIAQNYTLKILLLHANKHLSYLARRYQLKQIGDSLSLQIVDCDMLNQERTVLSLSGGESFLISLSLALGLSSLSSNNLKVESLFIDEGFGSLDIDSLNTAMDALEQLQLQGRKIGVISHVQEMSERIPVQIRLIKEDQGRSRIVVE